jgi:molybdopterin-guanine dinucleotide biosynthesis protein A
MPVGVAGTILAGGCSRRMGGQDKALLPLGGRPLLRHVVERVLPQVSELAISVERHVAAYETFGLSQLPDPASGHNGPLGGLLAALSHFGARHEWMLLTPCDAPFLPPDLAATLQRSAVAAGAACSVVRYRGELQPTFSIWHRDLLPGVEQAVLRDGLAGFKQFLRTIEAAKCDWQAPSDSLGPPPFLNINDPGELEAAARWLDPAPEEDSRCSA